MRRWIDAESDAFTRFTGTQFFRYIHSYVFLQLSP
jgi:hypothetical protein